MEDEISCDDPQFMNMLETCLQEKIAAATKMLLGLEAEITDFKAKVQLGLQARRDLKEKIKNTQENIMVLNTSLTKQNNYIIELSNKNDLMKLNLDNDYKLMRLESRQREDILKEYENTWQAYRKYEEFPLAKARTEAKVKLQKIRIEAMVVEYKIDRLKKISRQQEHIAWLILRGKIVEFSRAMLHNMALDKNLTDLNKTIDDRKEELNSIDKELSIRLKMQEEEKRVRELKMLEMPPPSVNHSRMRSIYLDAWKRNYENSIDSMSVDTVMLEEMCITDENSVEQRHRSSARVSKNCTPEDAIDTGSPPRNQHQEIGHNDGAVKMEENIEPEAIDGTVDDEPEQQMDVESEQEDAEEPTSSLNISKDKQAYERNEEEDDHPVAKRMKLMADAGKVRGSPATTSKDTRLGSKRSQLADPSPVLRIKKIETVRYSVSPMKKDVWAEPNPPGVQLPDRSPAPRITKMEKLPYGVSPMRKIDQANPNPASMFTPGHYEYSDSNLSFSVDNNLKGTKDDQLSLYDGSVRDFCECSNLSTPVRNTESDPVAGTNQMNLPSNRTQNFPRNCDVSFPMLLQVFIIYPFYSSAEFDFANILKGNKSRNNLF
ncbi:hypothetical protein WN55_06971 [Dufourea novaeangliae]|uniref:Uncharacterized protein n=1 Tax=Dufourea novaeangliae TaxID=178035 RepID=A0A154PTJ4_DUFNO|nr:hypothetical protein WN55_06971 [Dufourea novaeangliae]